MCVVGWVFSVVLGGCKWLPWRTEAEERCCFVGGRRCYTH